ncbi:MAG: InlB B-repeat-containing protein, partial [Defluviitaleaceae bacterium]|nr:InlB B-repeat-containing protein [Defluviitaleaceae bacterium]
QNPLNGVSWLMYYDSANNAEIYVTSATVPSYGTFRNVYMGMLRNMSGGGQSGALYAQTTSGWVHVGDLTFSEGVGGLSEGEIGSAHEDEITGFSQMTATVSGGGIFNFTRPTPLSTITNRPTLSGFFSWLFSYRIIFDANGGTVGTGTTLTKNVPQQSGGGSVVGTLPPTPRRLDFDFGGWFTTPNQTGGTQVTENTIVTGNTTYWARWIPQLNIDYPSFDGEILSRPAPHNIAIHWTQIPSATYTISLFNTSVGMYVFKDIPPFTADFGRIPYGYFYEGHEYEFTVNATIGSVVRTATRKFKIRLGSQRQTIINRALAMNSYKWTIPAEKSLVGWNTFLSENPTPNPYTFSPNNTYEGIPYTQSTQVTSHQSQVPWSVNAPLSFDEALNNRTNFFSTVDRYDGDVHIGYMPAYGTDCSGFVSIAIAPILAVDRELTTAPVERYTTAGLHSDTRFPRVRQDENESLRHRLARLSPGDFINASGNHTMIVYKIEPCDEIEGSLIVTTVEQSAYRPANSGPIVSGQRIWSNIRRTGRGEQAITSAHIGRVARSEMLQDYSWSWIE